LCRIVLITKIVLNQDSFGIKKKLICVNEEVENIFLIMKSLNSD